MAHLKITAKFVFKVPEHFFYHGYQNQKRQENGRVNIEHFFKQHRDNNRV